MTEPESSERTSTTTTTAVPPAGGCLQRAGRMSLEFIGILLLIALPVFLEPHLLFTYLSMTVAVAVMGWAVFTTHRDSPPEASLGKTPALLYLDVVDVILVLAVWLGVTWLVSALGFPDLSDKVGIVALVAGSAPIVRLRRFLFPRTMIPFHPDNLAIRETSVFCAIHALITLLFALTSKVIGAPSWATGFFLTAGALLVLAVWLYMLEFHRRPRLDPGV